MYTHIKIWSIVAIIIFVHSTNIYFWCARHHSKVLGTQQFIKLKLSALAEYAFQGRLTDNKQNVKYVTDLIKYIACLKLWSMGVCPKHGELLVPKVDREGLPDKVTFE